MTYDEAIDLIKSNPYNLGIVDKSLIDLKMLRFVRRYHKSSGAWALEAYSPKNIPDPDPSASKGSVILAKHILVWVDYVAIQNDIPLT
jgi:hypothetical protein